MRRYQGPAGIARRLSSDPPSLGHRPPARPIFDAQPHRNRGLDPAPPATPEMMNRIIAECVAFGMPRHIAEEARTNPYGPRYSVYFLASLIWDARAGDAEAKAALERIAVGIANADPVGEMLSAYEQPADPAELQRLLGSD